ncbi:MAG: tRNA (N6-isopentenyl adenosine(37)-C2)-methylthiotransferase MiaB [Candidatus Ratteibacteria bacterium]|nr:tRNA (N6-isopentenyl adenosine(37)-C2)-methylthiotransferase MiaB [Candidatus Ratteibacteria bacterium]
MKVFLQTFGCQMNKYDSEIMRSLLSKEGYKFTDDWQEADVILVNTCSVRQHAEERVYSYLGKWGKYKQIKKPNIIIGICGCMAQKEGMNLLDKMPYLNLVCGTYNIPKINEFVRHLLKTGGRRIETSEDYVDFPAPLYEAKENKLSAWIAIMRGCNNYCAYCVVPNVRGREISRPVEEIENEVKELARKGIKEVTLLGQNVNSYNIKYQKSPREIQGISGTKSSESFKDSRGNIKNDFALLLKKINDIEGIERIRFTTSHPKDMSIATIEAVRNLPKVCEHIHLALQSGSDKILKLMNRKYTRTQYQKLIEKIRENVPEVSITTDIMVGFPTETENDFMDTYNLVKEIEFDASYIFKYSTRPGTKAAELKDDVTEETKNERLNKLLSLQKRIAQKKNEKLIGKKVEVLVEKCDTKNSETMCIPELNKFQKCYVGKIRNFKSVSFQSDKDLIGKLVKIKITEVKRGLLYGNRIP